MRAPPSSWSMIRRRERSIWVRILTYEAKHMPHDTVTVERFYTDHASSLELNLIAGASGLKKRIIREPTVNRPGLVLSGFTRYFAFKRVQVIGNAEAYFLKSISGAEDRKSTRLNSSHQIISYAVFCLKKK